MMKRSVAWVLSFQFLVPFPIQGTLAQEPEDRSRAIQQFVEREQIRLKSYFEMTVSKVNPNLINVVSKDPSFLPTEYEYTVNLESEPFMIYVFEKGQDRDGRSVQQMVTAGEISLRAADLEGKSGVEVIRTVGSKIKGFAAGLVKMSVLAGARRDMSRVESTAEFKRVASALGFVAALGVTTVLSDRTRAGKGGAWSALATATVFGIVAYLGSEWFVQEEVVQRLKNGISQRIKERQAQIERLGLEPAALLTQMIEESERDLSAADSGNSDQGLMAGLLGLTGLLLLSPAVGKSPGRLFWLGLSSLAPSLLLWNLASKNQLGLVDPDALLAQVDRDFDAIIARASRVETVPNTGPRSKL